MHALSSKKQPLAKLPSPALGFEAANAAHAQFLSSKACVRDNFLSHCDNV
jgi:hypothetical protein